MDIIAFDALTVKWGERKKFNLEVSERMEKAGFSKRSFLMKFCGDSLGFNKCPDCGKTELSSANFCRDRLCPTCAWRLSLRRYAEMCCVMGAVADTVKPQKAAFFTVTVKNCYPNELRDTLQMMARAWNRMLARRTVKNMFVGWARSVEVTYNARTATFHPHFHIILLLSDEGAKTPDGVMRRFLSDCWYDAVQTSYRPITDYKVIDHHGDGAILGDDEELQGAILETYKYTVKHNDLMEMPLAVFRSFVLAMAGLRVASFGGCIKEARKNLGYKEDDDRDDTAGTEAGRKCPDCGQAMRHAILRWSFEENKYTAILDNLA